jgi:hypothetical protein
MSEIVARQSPWGPIMVVDAHVHFFSHRFFEILASQKPGLTVDGIRQKLDWQFPPQGPGELANLWVRELDRHGVHRAALIASVPGDEGSVIAAAQTHPDRFLTFAMVNPKTWNKETWSTETGSVRKMMNLSSSFDHRIVDGWEAASFIAKLKGLLENPATLFLS